ncbi:MAG: hypothetical protein GY832_41575 [Chloroflexi bacterium]|nr:hypothetical protein [Chloroflexota bacterium]
MKHCPQCNAQLPDDARFCHNCGPLQKTVPDTRARMEGAGAIAQDHSAAAGEGGVAVGGAVQGGVSVIHYHGVKGAEATALRPRFYHNLPHPDYGTFIGRQKELTKVHELLWPYPRSRFHIITIDGIGGIGKSALALKAAHRYIHEYETLPQDERFDAIIWISAKQTILTAQGIISRRTELHNLNDIYTTIAATLERKDITQARAEERSVIVARALARQRTLLIIDNLETVDDEQVIAFIHEVPDPTKVIVTTRQRIDVAHPIRLLEMSWEDTQGLIAQECEKKNVVLTDEQARQLYDRTGGIPLALVWSIARVALGEDIENVLSRLAHPDSDIARFCLEGIVQRLRDSESYKLLLAFALFAQDAPRKALGYVAGIKDKSSRIDGLIDLERLSLLNKQGDRFSLLPLTRSYLDHELEQVPEFAQAAFERMLTYYTQLVKPSKEIRIGVPYWDGLTNYAQGVSLEREQSNLLYLIRRALDQGRDAEALDLFLSIVHFLDIWGLWDERLHLSRTMCQTARKLGDSAEVWLWIDAIAYILSARRQFPEGIQVLKTGRALARQFELKDALILVDACEADLYAKMGDIDLAQKRFERALERVDLDSVLEQGTPIRRLIATRVVDLATWLVESQQDLVGQKEWHELRLQLRRSTGESTTPALLALAPISLRLGNLVAAENYLGQALVGAGKRDLPWINYELAVVAEKQGELQESRRFATMALGQFVHLERETEIQNCREFLARLPR